MNNFTFYSPTYFVFGKDEENNDSVYVGEAEKIIVRLKQHLNDHNYWNDCVVVISKDNILNKAHVKFLENKFYNLANDAKRATIINNTVPTCSSISEFDALYTTNQIQILKILLPFISPDMQKSIAVYIKFMELKVQDLFIKKIFYLRSKKIVILYTCKRWFMNNLFKLIKKSNNML